MALKCSGGTTPRSLTISQKAVAARMFYKSDATTEMETIMVVGLSLDKFDADEPDIEKPFRSPGWLANQTRAEILNEVRAVVPANTCG